MHFRVMHTFSGFCMSFAPVSSDSSDANLDRMAKLLFILEVKRNFVPTAKGAHRAMLSQSMAAVGKYALGTFH